MTDIKAHGVSLLIIVPGFAQTSDNTWDMVHIGVSQLGRVAQLYGERLGHDLGVQVNSWFRNARYSTAAEFLQSEEGKIVNEAEIVFVGMAAVAGRFEGYCLDTVTDQPYNQTPVELRKDIDAFLAELVRHADPSNTIIRIVLQRRHPGWKAMWVERGTVEDCAAGWMKRNAQWKEAAAAYGVPVIDPTAERVGTDGLGDAPEGFLMPGLTAGFTPEGVEAAAELVRRRLRTARRVTHTAKAGLLADARRPHGGGRADPRTLLGSSGSVGRQSASSPSSCSRNRSNASRSTGSN